MTAHQSTTENENQEEQQTAEPEPEPIDSLKLLDQLCKQNQRKP